MRDIKLAFSRPTANEEERAALFQHYSKIGYDGLQLKHSQYIGYIGEPDRFLAEWGNQSGVGSALIIGGTLDGANIAALRRLFGFAQKIGSTIIVFCHGIPRSEVTAQDIRSYAAVLSDLGKEAQQLGLSLSLHHHYNQPVMYRDDFDIFFNQVHDGSVGLTIDTAHLVKSGIVDVAEVITSFATYIDNFHLKDYAGGDWRVLGQGNIDFRPIFQAIQGVHYRGWMSADEESGGEMMRSMTECLHFMRQGLSDAGH
ncbi:sugar phosphate isomerase/epimerase family protein [Paenibacillus xerothermodurans]|uniref:Sugar phosphate isomerase/epimerase n=1 Tax=Paenibacillus xerothermodurans TaxID=1977292 RepID=A0A2W1N5J9_PAEXE|nr:TIM barrel protein [Paenibacillus xerothermodurans]PZE19657.1 sugar phosphate isomerase/epimerase [Paenibacillus xerothermodurans]